MILREQVGQRLAIALPLPAVLCNKAVATYTVDSEFPGIKINQGRRTNPA